MKNKKKKGKTKKIDKSILQWLPFKEVWNDLLFLDNDKVVGIIKVNSINLQLFSNEEQTSKIFLNKRSFGEPFSKPHSKVTL